MSCVELFRDDRFAVSEMPPGFGSRVASSLRQAREIRLQKLGEKDSAWTAKYIERRFPEFGSVQDTDVVGLAGEMVCEMYHVECKHRGLFYAKWKEAGTSKSRGVDLLVEEAGRLLSVECKHAHSPRSAGSESGLLQALKRGMADHSFHRTQEFLLDMYRVASERARRLRAEGSDTSQERARMRAVKGALAGGFDSEVDLVADRERAGAADFARLGSKVARIRPAQPGTGALLLVGRLHEVTEAA